MKILELARRLKKTYDKHGNIDVMIEADSEGLFEIAGVSYERVEEGDYPPTWNMPVGMKLFKIQNVKP